MCELSEDLKLCTCNTVSFSEGNYWAISRRKKGWIVIGQTIFNENQLNIKNNELDQLLEKINKKNIFDFDYIPHENDKLKVNFNVAGKNSDFEFIFSKGQWKYYHQSAFEKFEEMDLSPYIKEYSGKIKQPFKNKTNG